MRILENEFGEKILIPFNRSFSYLGTNINHLFQYINGRPSLVLDPKQKYIVRFDVYACSREETVEIFDFFKSHGISCRKNYIVEMFKIEIRKRVYFSSLIPSFKFDYNGVISVESRMKPKKVEELFSELRQLGYRTLYGFNGYPQKKVLI